jgi:hypothetical protein
MSSRQQAAAGVDGKPATESSLAAGGRTDSRSRFTDTYRLECQDLSNGERVVHFGYVHVICGESRILERFGSRACDALEPPWGIAVLVPKVSRPKARP